MSEALIPGACFGTVCITHEDPRGQQLIQSGLVPLLTRNGQNRCGWYSIAAEGSRSFKDSRIYPRNPVVHVSRGRPARRPASRLLQRQSDVIQAGRDIKLSSSRCPVACFAVT